MPLFLLVLALVLSACTDHPPGHRVIRTVVDGVDVVQTEGAPKFDGPLFDVEEDLVLGVDEGEPEWQQFGSYPRLLVAPDGKMVLADYVRYEIYIVGADGDLLHRFGRKGAGPGEFENLWLTHWNPPGEEIWVEDQQLFHISRFDMEGRFLGTVNTTRLRMRNTFISPLGGGRWLGSTGERLDSGDLQLVWEFLGADWGVTRSFMTMPQGPYYPTSASSGIPVPLTRGPGMAVGPSGTIVQWDPNEGYVDRYDENGVRIMRVERDWEFLPVTAAEKDSIRQRYRSSRSETYRRIAEDIPLPDTKPAILEIKVDDAGLLWVRRYDSGRLIPAAGEQAVFDLFGQDGVWLGVQAFDFQPLQILYGHVYRYGESEAGAPRLHRYRLVRRHPLR